MKIREVLKIGTQNLKEINDLDAILKARILLANVLNIKEEYLATHLEDEISEAERLKFECKIKKIEQGIPIQYITNQQNFYGLELYVDENVLIPQPDTEILVEEVINYTHEKTLKILDMCTGSGAIAIAIAKNSKCEMVAADISLEALEIAQKNASNHNVEVRFIASNMFEKINEKFDIIVSNPPYIESNIIDTLSNEVKNEPRIALDGGKDGLKFYRILAGRAGKYLNDGGILAVEIGFNQRENVMKIFENNGFCDVYYKKDFGNNDRIVVGRKKCHFHQK